MLTAPLPSDEPRAMPGTAGATCPRPWSTAGTSRVHVKVLAFRNDDRRPRCLTARHEPTADRMSARAAGLGVPHRAGVLPRAATRPVHPGVHGPPGQDAALDRPLPDRHLHRRSATGCATRWPASPPPSSRPCTWAGTASAWNTRPAGRRLAADNIRLAASQGATGTGEIVQGDARHLPALVPAELHGRIALVITSPPYGPSTHGHVRTPGPRRGKVRKINHRYGGDRQPRLPRPRPTRRRLHPDPHRRRRDPATRRHRRDHRPPLPPPRRADRHPRHGRRRRHQRRPATHTRSAARSSPASATAGSCPAPRSSSRRTSAPPSPRRPAMALAARRRGHPSSAFMTTHEVDRPSALTDETEPPAITVEFPHRCARNSIPGAAQALLALFTSRRDVSLDGGVVAEQDEAARPARA